MMYAVLISSFFRLGDIYLRLDRGLTYFGGEARVHVT